MSEEKTVQELHREIHEDQAEIMMLATEVLGLLAEKVDSLEDREWRASVVSVVLYGVMGFALGLCLSQLIG